MKHIKTIIKGNLQSLEDRDAGMPDLVPVGVQNLL